MPHRFRSARPRRRGAVILVETRPRSGLSAIVLVAIALTACMLLMN